MAYQDYPRMMFHRTKPPVTIHSRDEEDALGAEWRRTVWPPAGAQAAGPAPELSAASTVPEIDAAPGEGDPPGAPHPLCHEPAADEPDYAEWQRLQESRSAATKPERPQLTHNKLPANVAAAAEEAKANVKRPRAPTVKPTGKPKKKSRDW